MTPWLDGTVVGQTRWTERLLSLKVEGPRLSFEAGQFARLALDIGGERIARPYSFVNPPEDSPLEFYYAIVPEGPLSPRLAQLSSGDRVYVAPNPAGFLVLSEVPDARTLWLISTGTGIGPFLSILRSPTPWTRFERVVLVHAARHPQELVYADVVARIVNDHPSQLAFIQVTSAEPPAPAPVLHGRIPALIVNGSLEARAGLALGADTSQVLLCGNPDMVKEATAVLAERGMKKHRRRSPGQITVENYW
jgi:ferredoxin/flavodoxin---NADP+ reductase